MPVAIMQTIKQALNAVICQTIAHSGSKFTIIQHKSPQITDQRVVQEQ